MTDAFQNLGLFPSQRVLDNLMLGRYIHEKTGVKLPSA